MPRISLDAAITRAGAPGGREMSAPLAGNATDFNSLTNDGRTMFRVENTGASARVLTILFERTVQGQAVTSIATSVPAGEIWLFGPWDPKDFGRTLNVNPAHAELVFEIIQP